MQSGELPLTEHTMPYKVVSTEADQKLLTWEN